MMKVSNNFIYLFISLNDFIDIKMASPPCSPSHMLQGASRITGGILRGRALGNIFNFADTTPTEDQDGPMMGKVLIYKDHGVPSQTTPFMSLKHEVTRHLAPILHKLTTRYPILSRKCDIE
jgi:hypothetical protein